jgi:hypothetical protein
MLFAFRRSSARTTKPVKSRARRFNLESLERRELLSLGSEFAVNTTTPGAQYDSDNASSGNGHSVIVWTDQSSATSPGIRARLYNNGVATGRDFAVDSNPAPTNDSQPAVSMDPTGDFVVVWTATLPGGSRQVEARSFNSAGAPITGTMVLPAPSGATSQYEPDVAMNGVGDFAVVFTFDNARGDQDIGFLNFNLSGQNLNSPLTNTNVANSLLPETHASIARTPDGRFAVAYEVATNRGDHDIILDQFSSGGGILQATNVIANSTDDETLPDVSLNPNGNGVVAWQDHAALSIAVQPVVVLGAGSGTTTSYSTGIDVSFILARRFTRPGLMQQPGPVIGIFESLKTPASKPAVAYQVGTGDQPAAFAVAYNTAGGLFNSGNVGVTEVSASNAIQASYFVGASTVNPALSIGQGGNYLLSYTRFDRTSNVFITDPNIRARRGTL